MANYMISNGFAICGLEKVARGTLSTSLFSIPVKGPQVSPMQTFLDDMGLRGSPIEVYGKVAGVRHDEYNVKGDVFADTIPVWIRAILGGTDTVTGAGPTYTHTIPLLNNQTGSQPPSVSIQDFDGANAFQMLACQAQKLTITGGAEKSVEYDMTLMGNPFTKIGTPVPGTGNTTFSSETFAPGWNVATTINSTSFGTAAEWSIDIDRKSESVFTGGQQSPYVNFAGPLKVTGKGLFIIDSTSESFDALSSNSWGLSQTAVPMSIVITDPASSHTVTLQMTTVQFDTPKRNRGKSYLQIDVNFEAVGNTTDASSGYSDLKVIVVNGASAAY